MKRKNIVVSYHTKNIDFAVHLVFDLLVQGYSVFFDLLDENITSNNLTYVTSHLPHVERAIVIISPTYVQSANSQHELKQILENDIPHTTIFIDDVTIQDISKSAISDDWFEFKDYRNRDSYNNQITRFMRQLENVVLPDSYLLDEEYYLLELIRDTQVFLFNSFFHQAAHNLSGDFNYQVDLSRQGMDLWLREGNYTLRADANEPKQRTQDFVVSNLVEWLKVRSQLVLTGDAGCGKTFIARHLFLYTLYNRLAASKSNPLPIWIAANTWNQDDTIQTVLKDDLLDNIDNGELIIFVDELDSLAPHQINGIIQWLLATNHTLVATARRTDNLGLSQVALHIPYLTKGMVQNISHIYLQSDVASRFTQQLEETWKTVGEKNHSIYHQFDFVGWQMLLFALSNETLKAHSFGQIVSSLCEYQLRDANSKWSIDTVIERVQILAYKIINETEYDYFTRRDLLEYLGDDDFVDLILAMGIVDAVTPNSFRFRSATIQNYFAARQVYTEGVYSHLSYPTFGSQGHYQPTRWDVVIKMLTHYVAEIDYPALIENIADVDPFLALHCLQQEQSVSPYLQQDIIRKLLTNHPARPYPPKALLSTLGQFDDSAFVIESLVAIQRQDNVHSLQAFSLLIELNVAIPDALIDSIDAFDNTENLFPDAIFDILETYEGTQIASYLIILTTHPHLRIQKNAISLLGYLQDEAAIPALTHALGDDNHEIVQGAIQSLAAFKSPQAWNPILQHIDQCTEDDFSEILAALETYKRYSLRDLLLLYRLTQMPITQDLANLLASVDDDMLTLTLWQSLPDDIDLEPVDGSITEIRSKKEGNHMVKQLLKLLSNQMDMLSNHEAFNDFVKSLSNRQQTTAELTTQQMKERVQPQRSRDHVNPAENQTQDNLLEEKHESLIEYKEDLQDEDWEIRLEAIKLIAHHDSNEALSLLLESTQDEDAQVRIAALEALAKRPQYPIATDAIIKALDDEDCLVVDKVTDILKKHGETNLFRVLLKLNSDKINTIAAAIDVLGTIGNDTVVPSLTKFLEDERQPWVSEKTLRDFAAQALISINTPTALQAIHAAGYVARPDNGTILQPQDEQQQPQKNNGKAQFTHGERVTIALKALQGNDWHQSQKAARYIREYAKRLRGKHVPQVVELLQSALKDENWVVRWTATEALAWLKNPDTTDSILPQLQDDSWIVRVAAIQALVELEARQHASAIAQLLDDEEVAVREAVVEAIGILQNRDVLPQLLQKIEDANDFIRLATVQSIIALMDEEACLLIAPKLEDENHHIRWLTMKHIAQYPHQVDIGLFTKALEDYDKPHWEKKTISNFALAALEHINTEESNTIILRWQQAT